MKKILFASTALVAMGVVSAAQAAEPIKLGLGGFSRWYFGYADNDNAAGNFHSFDVQGDNEVFFKGSTTLDNGVKIAIDVQLEAGGAPDMGTDTIDESYVTVDTSFGRFIIGSENNGAYLLHVAAPDAIGYFEENGLIAGNWIVKPAAVTYLNATAINTDGDAEKITYVSPSFAGFTVGATYVPNAAEDTRQITGNTSAVTDVVGVGAAYANTFGGVGVKLSAGYAFADVAGVDDHDEWSLGAQLGFAGFTVGAAYRNVDSELTGGGDAASDGRAWTLGAMYATGPFAVSLAYFNSEVEGSAGGGEDEASIYQLSGKYTMGPGVDWHAAVGHVDWEDEGAVAGNSNDGWALFTGLSLAF